MANRVIVDALHSLLPTANPPLHTTLVGTALNLLAQSRTRAGSLKPEEEIARPYVCAHLACERLKTSLDLPPITPRPPCHPKTYQDLYTYFTTLLAPRRRGRPKKGDNPVEEPSRMIALSTTPVIRPLQPLELEDEPKPKPQPVEGRSRGRPSRGKRISEAAKDVELPKWLPRSIRSMARGLHNTDAIPHVLAGVTTILGRTSSDSDAKDYTKASEDESLTTTIDWRENKMALAVAVHLYVARRMQSKDSTEPDFDRDLQPIFELTAKDHRLAEERLTVDSESVSKWYLEIGARGWLQEAWYENIGDILSVDGDHDDPDDEANVTARELEDDVPFQITGGLGTMMHERVDFLSDKRTMAYTEWKKTILERIQAVQQQMFAVS